MQYSPAAAALAKKRAVELNDMRRQVKLIVLRGVCHGSVSPDEASDAIDKIDVMSMKALGEYAEKLAR